MTLGGVASGAVRQADPMRHGAFGAELIVALVPAVLCLALLAGCERQLPLALPANTPVQVFEVGGAHYTLDPSSDGYRTLARWVSNNRSGWSWSHYYTKPPSKGIIVRCGTLELQFFDTTVLDRRPEGDYLKTVQPSEYAFLKRDAGGT